jgi:hypothetical protein
MQDFLLALRQFTIFFLKATFAFTAAVLIFGFTFIGRLIVGVLRMKP